MASPLLFSSSAPFSNSYPPQLAGHGQQFYTCSPLNSEQDFASKYFTQSRSDHRLNTLSASCCINFAHITFHNHMVKIFTRFSTSQIEAVLSRTFNIIDMSLAAQPSPIVVTTCLLLLMKRPLQNLSSKYLRGSPFYSGVGKGPGKGATADEVGLSSALLLSNSLELTNFRIK